MEVACPVRGLRGGGSLKGGGGVFALVCKITSSLYLVLPK